MADIDRRRRKGNMRRKKTLDRSVGPHHGTIKMRKLSSPNKKTLEILYWIPETRRNHDKIIELWHPVNITISLQSQIRAMEKKKSTFSNNLLGNSMLAADIDLAVPTQVPTLQCRGHCCFSLAELCHMV